MQIYSSQIVSKNVNGKMNVEKTEIKHDGKKGEKTVTKIKNKKDKVKIINTTYITTNVTNIITNENNETIINITKFHITIFNNNKKSTELKKSN